MIKFHRHDWGTGELVVGALDYVSVRWTGTKLWPRGQSA